MRLKHGAENLCGAFYELLKLNPALTASRLNDSTLTFPTLYILMPHIKQTKLRLSDRNRFAIAFCEHNHKSFQASVQKTSLKWIFTTGVLDDGLCNEFDELLDIACQKLTLDHYDISTLSTAIDLMFRRNRKGGHVHDLAWCICESGQLKAMELISEYLRSDLEADNLLAYRILNFKPELQPNDKEMQYQNFHRWLNENKSFLYPAHQGFNQSSNPKAWRASLPSKYLYKPYNTLVQSGLKKNYESFLQLEEAEQKLLAKYSFKLHSNDMAVWNSFIKAPIEHQLTVAKMSEGSAYYI